VVSPSFQLFKIQVADDPDHEVSAGPTYAITFASRLVQAGVPLNTVRDLLGPSSVAMSLRYPHLAPDQRREAVAKLNKKPLLALTMRLAWNQ
jgi:hypothetical protein